MMLANERKVRFRAGVFVRRGLFIQLMKQSSEGALLAKLVILAGHVSCQGQKHDQ